MTTIDVAWQAGLLEGEGYLGTRNAPRGRTLATIELTMSDEDVIARVAAMWGVRYRKEVRATSTGKAMYRVRIAGGTAERVMRSVLPLMGARRASKINEIMSRLATPEL